MAIEQTGAIGAQSAAQDTKASDFGAALGKAEGDVATNPDTGGAGGDTALVIRKDSKGNPVI
jgi:hypothetical protein